MPDYEYVSGLNRYRNRDTGQFVSAVTVRDYVRRSIDATQPITRQLAGLASDGNLTGPAFRAAMREEVKREYIRQYLVGRGGRNAMTFRDWGIVGQQLRTQYRYLDGVVDAIESGAYDERAAALANRLDMYFNSSRQAFNLGETEARGMPRLSQVPGDGNTQCLTNCKCFLEFTRTASGWHVFWRLNVAAKHCEDCLHLSQTWSPLVVESGRIVNPTPVTLDAGELLAWEAAIRAALLTHAGQDHFTLSAHSVLEHHTHAESV